ncbi:MAG: beta-galactosidase [Bacteroidaceae bacterium]|nr:beta-galactosidase [Bacteroidaceae bacterium]
MKKNLFTLLAFIAFTTLFAQETSNSSGDSRSNTFRFGTNVNPEGVKFEVDSRGFIIGGKHVLPVMGEIHYARVPEQEWRREIQKMRAGGITVIATYVFWIHHEEEEGQWNWNGNKNLRKFIEICGEEKMPVVLRIGPFCHGEVYQGGFPVWLTDKAERDPQQFKLRSQAPGFMAATRNLYNNIFSQVDGLLWKQGGSIVGVQIENECRGPWSYYMALKDLAVEAGFDTPFYTRTGWPKLNGNEEFGKLLPLYGDYADGFWDRVLTDMPGDYKNAFVMKDTRLSAVIATEALGANQDTQMEEKDLSYPYLTCELGGGMMPSYHRRINMSGREVKPLAICKLGSGSNLPGYYMYHGGTNPYNPKHTMAETQATKVTNYNDMPHMTYDFQTLLGEMGQPNSVSWNESRLLHQFLADWGHLLSQMDVDTLSEHYARRGCFEFFNDYVRILNEEGASYVTPRDWPLSTLNTKLSTFINWATVEPFCQADGIFYFIAIEGKKPQICIDGKVITAKLNKPFKEKGVTFCVLSREKAYTAYKIGDKLYYSDGILYQDGERIMEEMWKELPTKVNYVLTQENGGLREVKMGSQKVASQPVESDFEKAAVWVISNLKELNQNLDLYLEIKYRGDVARVYADGQLVEDNFWNGKPMLVRLSDLVGKHVELKILPLGKDYPIYLQKEEKSLLNQAPNGILLSLDGIRVIERRTEEKTF